MRRWLRQEAFEPWQHCSWILISDPQFRTKAERVLDPYARTFDGITLDEDEYVISADEKPSIQARCRCHPTLAPGQARAMRVNHTYGRGGAWRRRRPSRAAVAVDETGGQRGVPTSGISISPLRRT
ncbi:hypothetical protein [Streptomyces sp. GMY02]|uniref:hypothetical protein n=1 Tax=Streptomyces sp. GMY02 TaxID=1333528 RepID=UPI0020B8F99D|nr:hypothetical protein [Streptomyces sp. GMY02]